MVWGPWMGPVHIVTLVLSALIIVGLYFLLRNKSEKTQVTVLGVLSFSGLFAITFNLLAWGAPLENLPLHLCSFNAMMLPITVFSRKKVLGNLLLLWSIGAVLALVFNQAWLDYKIFSMEFMVYFFPHTLEFGIPVLLFVFGLVKLDWKCLGSTLLISIGVYTCVYFFNVWLNDYALQHQIIASTGEILKVNYMYSVNPDISILQLMYSVIPYPYWYMFIAFPFLGVLLLIIYLPSILAERKAKRKAAQGV